MRAEVVDEDARDYRACREVGRVPHVAARFDEAGAYQRPQGNGLRCADGPVAAHDQTAAAGLAIAGRRRACASAKEIAVPPGRETREHPVAVCVVEVVKPLAWHPWADERHSMPGAQFGLKARCEVRPCRSVGGSLYDPFYDPNMIPI